MTITIDRCAILYPKGFSAPYGTFSLPKPRCHEDILKGEVPAWIAKAGYYHIQGFITNEGYFVDRKEAARIAFEAGQITKLKDELFSEDLW